MSKYTTLVRYICEEAIGMNDSGVFGPISAVIDGAIPHIFDFDFPIYDESYRNVLCGKILKHYYTREICEETVGLWKLRLDTRLNEIMPYYNELYKSAMIEFNPLYDVDLTTTYTKDNDGATDVTGKSILDGNKCSKRNATEIGSNTNTHTGANNTEEYSEDAYSDTPQGGLENVRKHKYLTNARIISNNGSGSDSSTDKGNSNRNTADNTTTKDDATTTTEGKTIVKSTEEYVQTVKGKNGGVSYSKMVQEFRKTILNIDVQIIDALSDLFFGLW